MPLKTFLSKICQEPPSETPFDLQSRPAATLDVATQPEGGSDANSDMALSDTLPTTTTTTTTTEGEEGALAEMGFDRDSGRAALERNGGDPSAVRATRGRAGRATRTKWTGGGIRRSRSGTTRSRASSEYTGAYEATSSWHIFFIIRYNTDAGVEFSLSGHSMYLCLNTTTASTSQIVQAVVDTARGRQQRTPPECRAGRGTIRHKACAESARARQTMLC